MSLVFKSREKKNDSFLPLQELSVSKRGFRSTRKSQPMCSWRHHTAFPFNRRRLGYLRCCPRRDIFGNYHNSICSMFLSFELIPQHNVWIKVFPSWSFSTNNTNEHTRTIRFAQKLSFWFFFVRLAWEWNFRKHGLGFLFISFYFHLVLFLSQEHNIDQNCLLTVRATVSDRFFVVFSYFFFFEICWRNYRIHLDRILDFLVLLDYIEKKNLTNPFSKLDLLW